MYQLKHPKNILNPIQQKDESRMLRWKKLWILTSTQNPIHHGIQTEFLKPAVMTEIITIMNHRHHCMSTSWMVTMTTTTPQTLLKNLTKTDATGVDPDASMAGESPVRMLP